MSMTVFSGAGREADSSNLEFKQHQRLEQQQQQQQQQQQKQQPWLDGGKRCRASCSTGISDCNNNNNNNNNGPQRSSSASSLSVDNDRPKASQLMSSATTQQQQQQQLQQSDSPFYMELRKKQYRNPIEERRPTRPLVQQMSRPLKRWLRHHGRTPYPTMADKRDLARQANMTVTQVSNWFANARRRLKNTVRDPSLSWSMRIKAYNRFAAGKQELMSSDSSDDDDEEEEEEEETGGISSSDSSRSQDSVGQENDGVVSSRSSYHVRYAADHKLSTLSGCTGKDTDDEDEADCISDRSPVCSYGNLSAKTSRAPLNLDEVHQLSEDAETTTTNRQSEFVAMCSRKSKKLRRSFPTSIKAARKSIPHGGEEKLGETGQKEIWKLEEIYSEMLRTRENSSKSNSSNEDLYWKEIGAAIALTRMARSRRQNSSPSSSSSSSSLDSIGMPRKLNFAIV